MPGHNGNPSKYNEARHKGIVEAVRQGNYKSTAAKLVGMHPHTLMGWLAEGENPESQYHQLALDVEQAEAEWEAEMLAKVRDAAEKPQNWAAAMTLLERRMPEKYGRNDIVRLEGGDNPIQIATHHIISSPARTELVLNRLGELSSRKTLPPAGVEGEAVEVDDDG